MNEANSLPMPADAEEERQERRPKFEPLLDDPQPIILGEQFWKNEKSTSFGYNITHLGVDKVWFVKKAGEAELSGYPAGTQLIVALRKKDPSSWPYLEVRRAIFEDNGAEAKTNPTEEKRKLMRDRYLECLEDAFDVEMNQSADTAIALSPTDLKDIATTFFIERNRKNF
jgi:hypothetical protein